MSALDEFVTRHRFTVDDFHRMGEAGPRALDSDPGIVVDLASLF